ncbi:MAG: AbrB/MazE/SpoVT family DNA-binding domain-containing protein [Bryobacteraceae bacterium]|jgi:AbrB family looped-hinge helix DNA binding protein
MPSSQPQVEYVANSRIGEKGQLTIPKQYRDELGLETGAPIAVLRVGEALILVPEQDRFRALCESITAVFERQKVSPADLLDTLPAARVRVFTRRYPELAGQSHHGNRGR